jgi:A/G-specific adenine glycosylase
MTVPARVPQRKKAQGPEPGDLLAWYDRHARVLPWRARRGDRMDPYRVWLSEIMLQQTTVKAVAPYYARFLSRWPTVDALAAASLDDVLRAWAGLGYYARARNLHVCAKAIVEQHSGHFPEDLDALRALPGIGEYTAAAVSAIAFDLPVVPVDGNVERVVSRLFTVEDELPAAKLKIKQFAASLLPSRRAGDFAQALMDLGATICSPKRPACVFFPWND